MSLMRGFSTMEVRPLFREVDGGSIPTSPLHIAYQRQIREAHGPVIPSASLKDCRVVPITKQDAAPIIHRYEWLGTMGRAVAAYGLVASTNRKLYGVCLFGWPGSPESRDICGRDNRQYAVCLERGACIHDAPANGASYLIRHAVRLSAQQHGWRIFYAYADETAGEIGTIYQALNWKYLGQNVGRPRARMRENWIRPDGRMVSSRSLRHVKLTPTKALALGWTRVLVPPKHKYVWFEDRSLEAECRYSFLPYPKRVAGGCVDGAA